MMRQLLGLLAAVILLTGCEKEPGSAPKPKVAPQTVVMYLPWAGNLYYNFENNIADARKAVAKGALGSGRLLVFLQTDPTNGTLRELYHKNGTCQEKVLKTYSGLNVTQASTIAAILSDVAAVAPAEQYAMTVGSHGMAWIPSPQASSKLNLGVPREKEHWEYVSPDGQITRWFGDGSTRSTNTATFAQGIAASGVKFEYILFDVCFMSTVEVVYDLRHAAKYIVGSPCEVMGYGFPYHKAIPFMFTDAGRSYDLEAICRAYYEFYSTYEAPLYNCGAIAVTDCSQMDALAEVMRDINAASTAYVPNPANPLQIYDTYSPTRFFDYGDYVRKFCTDQALLSEFERVLALAVPTQYRFHTDAYYSAGRKNPIKASAYTGIMTSDPSTSTAVIPYIQGTAWYTATH